MAEAFEYLHSRGIAHRDLKLDNVLIEEKTNMIKIIDFGFAAFCQEGQKQKIFCGTPSYMAPELVKKAEYDGRHVDMWALGVLLFAMLSGTFPFKGQSEKELYGKIQRAQFRYPDNMTREAKYIISRLLEVDPRRRFRAQDLMRENWIKCTDLPLSIFETAGGLFRANSMDGRAIMSLTMSENNDAPPATRSSSKAEGFNKSIAKLHVKAVDHLKNMGFSSKAIDDSLRQATADKSSGNQIYHAYQEQIDVSIKHLLK